MVIQEALVHKAHSILGNVNVIPPNTKHELAWQSVSTQSSEADTHTQRLSDLDFLGLTLSKMHVNTFRNGSPVAPI